MIVVIGHNNPDIDTIASSIALTYLLNQKENKAKCVIGKGKMNKEVIEMLNFLKIDVPPVWTEELIKNPTILVDFNDKEQAAGNFNNVIKIIDHHSKTASTFPCENNNIEDIGSTSTLIAIDCLSELEEIDKKIATLLLIGIISDTKGFTSPQTNEIDKQMANVLSLKAQINIQELQNLIEEWSCFNWEENLINEYMNEGIKVMKIKDKEFISSVVFTKNKDDFITNKELIINHIKQLDKKNIRMLILVDILYKQTILFHNEVLNLENPYIIEGISSRKKEIKDLVFNAIM